MAVVPLVLAHRHAIAVLLEQVLVGGIAVRAFPAAKFHEMAAEFLLALPERRAAHVPSLRERLARMDRGIVDLHRCLGAAVVDELLFGLVRIEPGIVDLVMVDLGASVGHPVGDQLAHAGPVLDPDGDGVPQPPHLLALAHRRPAIGGHLQQAVEGMALVEAEFTQDRRQLHGTLERLHDLVHVEVALRRRQPRLLLGQKLARMDEARVGLLVVAPLDLAAFGRLRVAGVAHVGGVALVAHQRPADLLAGAGKFLVWPEEGQRMVDRHHRQVFAGQCGGQTSPDAGAHHHVVGHDRAAARHHALDPAVLDHQ